VCSTAVIIAKGKVLFSGTPTQLAGRSIYHNAVNIGITNTLADSVIQALGNIEQVANVETSVIDSDNQMLTVIPKGNISIVDEVRASLTAGGWSSSQLFIESGRLDEVFRSITTTSAGEDART
jgi:ABC-2 type transport system ATP-binding protein